MSKQTIIGTAVQDHSLARMSPAPCLPARLARIRACGLGLALTCLWLQSAAAMESSPIPSSPTVTTTTEIQPIPDLVPATPVSGLRRLPDVLGGWRLSGETDQREWVVNLSAADARRPASFQLATKSAISVMPEDSAVTIMINGRVVGTQVLQAAHANDVTQIAIPTRLLVAGANVIRVEVRQRHRVDCSIASTYELWSEIDPAKSGLLMNQPGPQMSNPADLGAIWPNERGELAISVVVPGEGDQEIMDIGAAVVGRLALMSHALHPVVDVSRTGGTGPGIDVMLGTPANLAKLLPGVSLALGEPRIVDPAEDGRARFVIAGRTRADFEQALSALDLAATTATNADSDLARSAIRRIDGFPVRPGQRLTFADLGFKSTEFDGRLHRLVMNIRMPSDFFSADTDKIRIGLDGGYAAHLNPDSKVVARVNGNPVTVLPLPDARGEVFSDRAIALSLSAFHPGLNRIEIDTEVASDADRTCDVTSIGRGSKRLLLLEESSLSIPDLPRMGYFPDLAATAAGGLFPGDQPGKVSVFVPHPDPESLSAALTLSAQFAVSAGRPVAPAFRFGLPDVDQGAAIIIGAASDLAETTLQRFGINTAEVRAAWGYRGERTKSANTSPYDAIDRRLSVLRTRVEAGDTPLLTGAISARLTGKRIADMSENLSSTDMKNSWLKSQTETGLISGWTGPGIKSVLRLASIGEPTQKPFKLGPSTALVVAQTGSDDRSMPWTLVTASSPQDLKAGVNDMTAPDRWNRMAGGITTYDAVNNAIVGHPAKDGFFVQSQPLSVSNLRLVLAAWLSRHVLPYAIALVVLALAVGLVLGRKVRAVGQKP